MPDDAVLPVNGQLEPPPSLGRISAFLNDVTHTSAFDALTDDAPAPIGLAGVGAQNMAGEVLGRASFGGLLPVQKDRNALADKYSIQSRDVRDFSQWLVKYRDRQEESENVIHVQVIERPVPGPERVVQGPPRDLTQEELELLIRQAGGKGQTPSSSLSDRKHGEPSQVPPASESSGTARRDYNGPTTQESREAVGFLNRGVWGSNLALGNFIGGVASATPMTPGTGPGVGYLMQGFGVGHSGMGGMAAYHGMPGGLATAGQMAFGTPGLAFGGGIGGAIAPASPQAAAWAQGFAAGAHSSGVGGFGGVVPTVFDTAPGPQGMGVAPSPLGLIAGKTLLNPGLTPTPQMGQMTLLAPPMQVASQQSEQAGTGVQFEWADLVKGARPVDEGGLNLLRESLPEGSSFIYPAISPYQLPPGAVNLNLTPSLSRQLLASGYGIDNVALAAQSSGLALASSGGSPIGGVLPGAIVPLAPPMIAMAGILPPSTSGPAGLLSEAGAGHARSGGALDFLGMPVRLAPALGSTSEARQEHDIRASFADPSRSSIIRPDQFGALRNHLFGAFHSVNAEPDQAAWQRAAPAFGLRDTEPATLLSPDARIKMPSAGAPIPQIEGSSDPIGRSIGMASIASDSLRDAHSASSSSDFGSIGSGPSSIGGSVPMPTAAPALGQPPSFGGTAMSSFPAHQSQGFSSAPTPPRFGHASLPSYPTQSLGRTAFAGLPASSGETGGFSGSAPSFGHPSAPMGFSSPPNFAMTSGSGPGPSASPPHLPMLGALRSTATPPQIGSSPSLLGSSPSVPTSGFGHSMAVPSGLSFTQPSGPPARSTALPTSSSSSLGMPTASPVQQDSSPMGSASVGSLPQYSPPPLSLGSSPEPAFHQPDRYDQSPGAPPAPMNLRFPSPQPIHPPSFMSPIRTSMPLRHQPEPTPSASSAVIQASNARLGAPIPEPHHDARGETGRTNELANTATDVNLVAREVWSLLKRRIAQDAERHGLR